MRGAREASGPGSEQRRRRWKREPSPGTLRPAAEDGVREAGTALGAPHQLHQLFSLFGHDGAPANESLRSGLPPRNMGKGRLRRQGVTGLQSRSSWPLRREAGERRKSCIQLCACQTAPAAAKFPVPEVSNHPLPAPLSLPSHHTQEPGSHLPGSGSGRGRRCGPLWKPLVMLSSVPGPKCFYFSGRERHGRHCERQTWIHAPDRVEPAT